MFVLGIDPGLSRCGYGVVTRRGGALAAVAGGVISTPPMPLPERLRTLSDELRALVAEFRPDAVVVERVFFQVNARTAMATGQAAGVALVAAAESGCEVAQYTSNEVKQAVVGYGSATKEQVQRMVASRARAGRAAPSPGRGRRPGPGRLSPDHPAAAPGGRPRPPPTGTAPMIGSLRGTLVDRPAPGEVHRRGRRGRLPGLGADLRRWPASARRAARSSSTSTPTCARTPSCSTASPTPTSGGASRPCSAPTASDRRWPWPSCRRCRPAALSTAVLEDDVDTLCLVPGVGKKTAARLLLELKARLDLPTLRRAGGPAAGGGSARGEVRAALVELGYGPEEIRGALDVGRRTTARSRRWCARPCGSWRGNR